MTPPGFKPLIEDVYLKLARQALKRLDFDEARRRVAELRGELGFPGMKPRDSRSMAWVLDGIRISMFIDCEMGKLEAVKRHVEEVEDKLGDLAPVPKVALSWAKGWRAELRGRMPEAYMHRVSACHDDWNLRRIDDLATTDARDWRYGDATEAALLLDCFADAIRTLRVRRPPIGTSKFKRQELADGLRNHRIMALLDHDAIDIWSYRRAYARLGFEAADRGDPEEAHRCLTLAKGAFRTRDPQNEFAMLAGLERPLLHAELEFARAKLAGAAHDQQKVEGLRRRAVEGALLNPHRFGRRVDFIQAQWAFFLSTHGT